MREEANLDVVNIVSSVCMMITSLCLLGASVISFLAKWRGGK